jgi:hypothetical protein
MGMRIEMNLKKACNSIMFILILVLLQDQLVFGQNKTKNLHVGRATSAPKVDGRLEDACWKEIEPVSKFFQFDPVNGVEASEETLVWATYDGKYIYFAFLMKDSEPDKIWAELTPRNLYEDNDSITLMLDTYNDKRTSIQFTVNPRGVQKNSVETIWKSGATIREDGWSAELAIPFKSLRFSPQKEQVWGVNFQRYIARLKEIDYWTDVSRDIPVLQQMGKLVGLSGIKPSYNLEIFPYFGGRFSRWEGEKDDKVALGLDVKYGILPNLILDMTASPDFSEVESDPFIYQLSPYENYFRENRPFFTEGSQFFEGDREHRWRRHEEFNLFYTRRIHSPRIAAKVTGKSKGWSFGFLGALNKGDEDIDEKNGLFSVVRIKKDILKNSQIGFYYAGKDESDDYNRNFGIDYSFNFRDFYYIKGQSAFSLNKYSDKHQVGMHSFKFERIPDAGLQLELNYRRVEKNVDIWTGYINKIDFQSSDLKTGYAWRFKRGKIKRVNFEARGEFEHDCSGNLTQKTFHFSLNAEFLSRMSTRFMSRIGKSKYQIFDQEGALFWSNEFIDAYGADIMVNWNRSGVFKGLEIHGEYDHKGIYTSDYTAIEGGIEMDMDVSLVFRPRSNIEVSLGGKWTHQTIDRTDETVFNGITYQANFHYQATRKLFLSSFLTGETRDGQYNLDVLIGYYFGAGNIVQLSYKKGHRLGDLQMENGYSLTLKVSYLLRI